MHDEYVLAVPPDSRRWLAIAWLWLGIMALLGSGVFSVLLVLSRTPYIQDVFPWIDFFRTALVVHVDLSVLVWFLAFGGVLWSLNSTPRFMVLGWSALGFAALGAALERPPWVRHCSAPGAGHNLLLEAPAAVAASLADLMEQE